MADNVAITAGSGTTIATDDVSGVHYQRVKLVDGVLDGSTALEFNVDDFDTGGGTDNQTLVGIAVAASGGHATITGDVANGLDVDVTRVSGNVTVVQATAANLKVDASGAAVPVTDNSGSLTVDGTVTAVGDVAHGSADSGNPQKNGAKAKTSPAGLTLAADNNRTDLYADLDGLLMIKPYTSYGDILSERVTNTDGNSTALSTFGATANARNFVSTITVYNSSTTNGYLDLRDGTAGSVIYTIPLPALGGATITFPVPLRQPTTNTALAYDVSAALTTVYISIVGFKSKA